MTNYNHSIESLSST